MKKRITFILLLLIMLGTIAYFYVNRIFLPQKVKHVFEQKISEYTHRPVSVEKLHFSIFKGMTLSNITLREAQQNRIFVTIDQVNFNFLLTPFLKNKTLVIPKITFTKPHAQVTQFEDGSFNFTDILANLNKTAPIKKYELFISKIEIENGYVDFLKRKPSNDFSENFRDINITLTLSLDKTIDFASNLSIPTDDSQISLKGNYTLGSQNIKTNVTLSKFNIMKYLPHFEMAQSLPLKAGKIASAQLVVLKNKNATTVSGDALLSQSLFKVGSFHHIRGDLRLLNSNFVIKEKSITGKGELRFPSAIVKLKNGKTFQGDAQTQITAFVWDSQELLVKGNLKINNAKLNLNSTQNFKSHIVSRDATVQYRSNEFTCHGNFDFDQAEFFLANNQKFNGSLSSKNSSLRYYKNKWNIKSDVVIHESQTVLGDYSLKNMKIDANALQLDYGLGEFDLRAPLKFTDTLISRQQGGRFQGSPEIYLEMKRSEQGEPLSTRGDITLTNGFLIGIPYIETASNIQGNLAFSKSHIETKNLLFNTQDADIELAGKIDLQPSFPLNFTASSPDVETQRICEFFPAIQDKAHINLVGRSGLRMNYSGSLKEFSKGKILLEADLNNVVLTSDKFNTPVTEIFGNLSYEADKIAWSNLKGTYNNTPYIITGELNNFSKPKITTSIGSENLDAIAEIELFHKIVRIPAIDANYLNSSFTGSADVYLFENVPADVQIKGDALIDITDAAKLTPIYATHLNKLNLQGLVDSEIFFKGKIHDWKNWSLSLDGKSRNISVREHQLNNVKIKYLQRDKNISKLDITSGFHEGKINFTSTVNLEDNSFPYQADLGLYRVNLAEFVRTQNLKRQKLTGDLTFYLDMAGRIKNQSTWNGEGNFEIRDGHIWQLKIIQGLSSILLIPEFKNTIYTAASGRFFIQDKKILTNNTLLESQTMKLMGKGWIDFDGKINFDITPKLSEIAMIESDSMKKWSSAFLSANVSRVRLTGSIQQPKYKANASPLKIIKGTTGVIREGIGGILGEIF